MKIRGKFDVTIDSLDSYIQGKNEMTLGRMSIDKRFHGELEGKSRGEMLSVVTPVQGSAGYVAIEHVEARLSGKQGGFVLL